MPQIDQATIDAVLFHKKGLLPELRIVIAVELDIDFGAKGGFDLEAIQAVLDTAREYGGAEIVKVTEKRRSRKSA